MTAKKTEKKEEDKPEVEEKKVAKKKKVSKKKAEKKPEVKIKYFVLDSADRVYTEEANGFDLVLVAGKKQEVTKEVAELCKKDFSYLTVSEVEA